MNSELVNLKRLLKADIPQGQSIFLFGPRKTGKSTYIKNHFPKSIYYDLLKTDEYLRLSKEPYQLREEIQSLDKEKLKHPIIIDEVQRVPLLLNEVHWLIENTEAYFILCGSSARKLKKESANLLGGRAWDYKFFPLVTREIPDFDLLRALQHGLVPQHYLAKNPKKFFQAYLNTYLKEEIKEEGLVRKLPEFSRFLDSLAYSHAELTNYSNVARDCGVDSKTVKEYYQILIDTLIGSYIEPFSKKGGRETISATPKFYLFDLGIANHIMKKNITELKGKDAGNAFEHFILMELIAYRGIYDKDFEVKFWRTKSDLEVDFILTCLKDVKAAIEVKISDNIHKSDIKGLIAFKEENPEVPAYVVCQIPRARTISTKDGLEIKALPWQEFLEKLWSDKLV